jgi:cystathionine beta-lyase
LTIHLLAGVPAVPVPVRRFVPFLAIDHELTQAETTFTFMSATKGWNIAGLKCGLAVAGAPAGITLLGPCGAWPRP